MEFITFIQSFRHFGFSRNFRLKKALNDKGINIHYTNFTKSSST